MSSQYAACGYRCLGCGEEYVVGMCATPGGEWAALNPSCPSCGNVISWYTGRRAMDNLPDDVLADLFAIRTAIRDVSRG